MEKHTDLDVRAVANALLKEAWTRGASVSNLKLQKLLFLCQAFYLIKSGGNNLIKGSFEAWQYGPVHRDAYDAFKEFGDKEINQEAMRVNPITLEKSAIDSPADQVIRDIISDVIRGYGSWTAAQLVELTHKKNGPWDHVVQSASSHANMGLKISNEVIKKCFKYHWFGTQQPLEGNPDDEKILIA